LIESHFSNNSASLYSECFSGYLLIRNEIKEELKMSEKWNGIPREEIPWYPAIDQEKCLGCGACVDFCSHGTYEMNHDTGKPIVKNPYHCVVGCSGCKLQCPAEAISFPPLTILNQFIEKK
jgi:NAD-dependent dihydropyrimidine dehydrogenase PreA subunit